jgi:hypothetical protein
MAAACIGAHDVAPAVHQQDFDFGSAEIASSLTLRCERAEHGKIAQQERQSQRLIMHVLPWLA